jgi:hypothetical protein
MNNAFRRTIAYLKEKPTLIFFIDGMGALSTASILFVSRNFNDYVGLSVLVLTSLAGIALLLCVYTMACFFLLNRNFIPFIKAICYANVFYCIVTVVVLMLYYQSVTVLGMAYFLIELLIIFALVIVEHHVSKSHADGHQ